jgi:hypothetical protein
MYGTYALEEEESNFKVVVKSTEELCIRGLKFAVSQVPTCTGY